MSDNVINKVTSLEIIVIMVNSKPYYEIKYKKVGEDYYHVGYGSYDLNNVVKWYNECFELANGEMTNADRIRSMSDEDLLDFICSIETYDQGSVITIKGGIAMCSVSEVEKWLQSSVDDGVLDLENFEIRR